MSLVMNGDEQAPWSAKDEAELLTGQADSRRVYHGHVLLYILRYKSIKQLLVSILEHIPGF